MAAAFLHFILVMAAAFLHSVLQVEDHCRRSPLERLPLHRCLTPASEGDAASETACESLLQDFGESGSCTNNLFYVDRTSEFAASTNGREGGWRGAGYNPNFENADEYPPRPEHVEAPSAKEIDLNALANKNNREQYTVEDKRNIYAMLLARNGERGRLKKGVLDSVVRDGNCSRRCASKIWKETKTGGGVNSIKNNLKLKTGRKKMSLDIEALEAIPPGERTTIRQVAAGLNMSKSTVHRRLKEKVMRRVSNELKPSLTEANKKARVAYCLENLEPSSLEDNPTFKASFNKVHLDEKIFYRTRKTQKMYLSHREEAPKRECKHKNHIPQIMFLSAMARPRYDSQGNCVFDGKIGVWAFVDWVQAQKKSANRGRGEWELKPSSSVDRNKSREYIVQYVLPAIKEKWPESDRWNTVCIQQDNARTHVLANDPIFAMEAAKGGWDIRIVNQPPNSPDCNILDLGWFASIQSMFHRKMPKTLPEIVQKVNESLAQYPHRKLNRICPLKFILKFFHLALCDFHLAICLLHLGICLLYLGIYLPHLGTDLLHALHVHDSWGEMRQ
ncbi:uncharacterized protein [Triticum aestivum]|uniref:uncharacterized protein n=1 Tax=Triticum aestivum TaxID=4565 RepID=UPI001D02E636|nr:uncharacterized protein LOC123076475 [Triticum aestivum]